MRLYLLLIALFSSQISYGQFSYIPHARTLNAGGVQTDFGFEYFQTTGVVDSTGEGFSLVDGTSYVKYDFDFTGKYGFTSGLEGMGGVRGRVIQARDNFGGEEFSYNRSGAESAILGFKYSFKEEDKTKYAFEGWYRQALHTNDEYTVGSEPTEISLGDDTRELALGLDFYVRTSSDNFLQGRVLYVDPSQFLSSEVFSEFEFAFVWEYFAMYAGIENVYSLDGDEETEYKTSAIDTTGKPVVFNGPSALYNSINRSWTAPYIGANIALGKSWRFEGRYTQITTGNSTDIGPRISLNLIKRNDDKKEFKKRDSKFKQYRIEGSVVKVSKKRGAAIINRGLASGLKLGMRVDFYYFDYIDGNKLIARGVVVKTSASKSLVRIKKRYSKRRVAPGVVARAGQIEE